MYVVYSRVPIRRHGTFIRHTSFIRPNTFPKKWAVPYNWISMSNWSTFRYNFVCINLHLLYRPRHPCLLFGTTHEASDDPCLTYIPQTSPNWNSRGHDSRCMTNVAVISIKKLQRQMGGHSLYGLEWPLTTIETYFYWNLERVTINKYCIWLL